MGATTRTRRRTRKAKARNRVSPFVTVGGLLLIVLVITGGLLALRRPATRAPSSGPPAPDFTVPTLDGSTFTLSEHRGQLVVLFAMAYWCGTCIPEARALARIQQEFGDRVAIVALDVDPSSTPEALARFRQQAGNPDYVWAFDSGSRVTQAYRIRSLDTTFIINQAGEIVYSDAYPTSYGTLRTQIRNLLE